MGERLVVTSGEKLVAHYGVAGPFMLRGPYVDVTTTTGSYRYAALTAELIEALSRSHATDGEIDLAAVEFHSWTSMATDPDRARVD